MIDGLDECVSPKAQNQLNDSVRFLVARRPEQVIRTSFNASSLSRVTMRVPGLDETYKPNVDIKTFLISRFLEIKRIILQGAFLPEIWPRALLRPSSQNHRAIPLRVHRDEVCRISSSPAERQAENHPWGFGIRNDAPFAELDTVYRHVLSNISPYNREGVIEGLAFLILTTSVPKSVFIDGMAVFYDYLPRTVESSL